MRAVDFKGGEKLVQRIALKDITTSHNPRNPAPELVAALPKEGYEGLSLVQFSQLGLSQDEKERATYCKLIEQYETDPEGILGLAASRRTAEVEPILLRDFRILAHPQPEGEANVYITKYGIIAGERRYLAAVYNYAKYGDNPTIGAVVMKMKVEDAERLAFVENVFRRNPHPLEIGEFLHAQREKINPETGKKYKLAALAKEFGMDYQFALGRESLVYLSDEDKRKLLAGRLGVTRAIQKGMALKRGEDLAIAEKKVKRQRVLKLTDVRKLFDTSYNGTTLSAMEIQGYRLALAEVMGLTWEAAIAESLKRQDQKELEEAKEVERQIRSGQ